MNWKLIGWYASTALVSVPQAAGPVVFSLAALSLSGSTRLGAALMLAMILSQVIGAVPVTNFGKRLASPHYIRYLVLIRSVALSLMAACTLLKAPVGVLFPLVIVAGALAGVAHGFLRAELGNLVRLSQMPRALGIVSTLNELTYVLAPVLVSLIGFISPALAILAVALLTALPAILAPPLHLSGTEPEHTSEGRILSFWILFWLTCSAVGGSSVGTIEIGAVALALQFGFKPELAILFTVPLCLASVASGIWVSWRNHEAKELELFLQLLMMACGAVLAALQISVWTQVLACVLIGSAIAPIATFYSLRLEKLAPKNRHPEVFALFRTSNAVGVIFASALIAFWSLAAALYVIAGLMAAMVISVGYVAMTARR